MAQLLTTSTQQKRPGKPDPIDALKGEWPAAWYKKFYKYVKPTQWIKEHWRDAL